MIKKMIALSSKAAAQLFALKNNIEVGSDAWQKIGVPGKWDGHPTGTFTMDTAVFEQMVANYETAQIDIVCDYEHQTLWGVEAPASGWIHKEPISLKVENGELYAKIDWTDRAKAYIEATEYRYLSPVFAPNTISQKDASNIGWTLHSVALTNKPFLEELDEVAANKLTQLHHQKEEEPMTEAEKKQMEDLQKENQDLKDEVVSLKNDKGDLENKLTEHADREAEAKVDAAIAAKKLHADQKESALKMCKADPMVQVPGSDLFDNKGGQSNGGDVDVVAMALGNE
jgi:phage I-like protein